jgi:hypothetical protein
MYFHLQVPSTGLIWEDECTPPAVLVDRADEPVIRLAFGSDLRPEGLKVGDWLSGMDGVTGGILFLQVREAEMLIANLQDAIRSAQHPISPADPSGNSATSRL